MEIHKQVKKEQRLTAGDNELVINQVKKEWAYEAVSENLNNWEVMDKGKAQKIIDSWKEEININTIENEQKI